MLEELKKIKDNQPVDQTLNAIIGGDGAQSLTNTQIIEVWGEQLPRTSLLGGGTMVTGKKNLGIKGKHFVKNLEHLCEGARSDLTLQTTPLQLLKIKRGNEIKYGCLFGLGLAVNFLAIYYNKACIPKNEDWIDDKQSHPAYGALLVAKGIASAALSALSGGHWGKYAKHLTKTQHLDIEYNGNTITNDFGGLLCGTISDVGFGFNLLPQDPYGTDQFQMLAVTEDMPKSAYLTNFLRFRSGKPALQGLSSNSQLLKEQPFYFDETTTCLITTLPPKSLYQLDGEVYRCNKISSDTVEVTLGPQLEVFTRFNP
jgi:hypothetical protein